MLLATSCHDTTTSYHDNNLRCCRACIHPLKSVAKNAFLRNPKSLSVPATSAWHLPATVARQRSNGRRLIMIEGCSLHVYIICMYMYVYVYRCIYTYHIRMRALCSSYMYICMCMYIYIVYKDARSCRACRLIPFGSMSSNLGEFCSQHVQSVLSETHILSYVL